MCVCVSVFVLLVGGGSVIDLMSVTTDQHRFRIAALLNYLWKFPQHQASFVRMST